MKIEPCILAPHLEAAAVDQPAFDLQAQGYTVERQAADSRGKLRFDLIARRGGETSFYEVKVVGQRPDPQTPPLSLLTREARLNGGGLHLILVRPERGADVSAAGLEEALRPSLSSDPTGELRLLGDRLSVEGVGGVEIEGIKVRQSGEVDVTGTAVVTLSRSAEQDGAESARDQVPFSFRAAIGPNGTVLDDPSPEYKIDLSGWDGGQAGGRGASQGG